MKRSEAAIHNACYLAKVEKAIVTVRAATRAVKRGDTAALVDLGYQQEHIDRLMLNHHQGRRPFPRCLLKELKQNRKYLKQELAQSVSVDKESH